MGTVPFQFSRDSFLGKLIADVWVESGHSEQELIDAFNTHNPGEAFFFTPNAEKQVFMNLLPTQFRKDIEKGEFMLVGEKFEDLVKGNSHITPTPKPDVALELVEWIFTGFDLDDLVLDLLSIFFNKKITFPPGFLDKVRAHYVKQLNEPA